jgi:hypothetical protein
MSFRATAQGTPDISKKNNIMSNYEATAIRLKKANDNTPHTVQQQTKKARYMSPPLVSFTGMDSAKAQSPPSGIPSMNNMAGKKNPGMLLLSLSQSELNR